MSPTRGWYPDPDGDGERFHDGNRWTGVTRGGSRGTTPPPPPRSWSPPPPKQRHRTAWTIVLVLSVVVGLGALGLVRRVGPFSELAARIGINTPDRVLPEVDPQVTSTAYSIAKRDAAGDPVTYDPCRAIHYVINPAAAPPDYLAFISPAIDAAQAASGLRFIYDGLSDETWADRQHGGTGPVVISFVRELSGDAVTSETVGVGGSSWQTLNGAVLPHYSTGAVALKQGWFRQQSAEGRTEIEQAVVMHELGHVLGLGHVKDPTELMAATNTGQLAYGAGDLTGLARLGSGTCVP